MNMINTALSGLNASMAALQTVSNNVNNEMTPGYSRQQVVLSAVGGGPHGAGNGVRVDGVRRISDQYQVSQIWHTTSAEGFTKVQNGYFNNIEQVFAADGNNLSRGLDRFFAALNSAQEQPNEIAYRQAVLNEATGISQRFNSISEGVNAQLQQISGQMTSSVREVNTLLHNIADFNKKLSASNSIVPPATLLDARDVAINKLANLVNVRVVTDNRGLVNISLRQGQPLLSGTTSGQMSIVTSPKNPDKPVLTLKFGKSDFPLNDDTGGSLGALVHYRDNELSHAKAFLDEMATLMADKMNDLQTKNGGTDLNGAKATVPLFKFEPNNPAGSMRVNKDIKPEMLAFGKDGTPGDNSNLMAMIKLAGEPLDFKTVGTKASLGDAFASQVGVLGSKARQAQLDKETAIAMKKEANKQWSSTSGVTPDEEGANLLAYQQAYQANAKVIASADQLFKSILNSF
ncbi:flagellar hook-associated protein 1 [Shewanella sp. NFH-SH190041]|uniref:flagellar hook-associated protein FlgK n=1 Tax=Shewanella sp. NFH-SH190041 TaxID=2950245 RepID=UPI0021C47F44|nr:flagellar hook-associated protein FlgK [Shewanella sp. NFH-SH190041]BDM62714.1 flagellar hook-associated protein 1 [Shewanella sp. NFH-SH190041]